MFMYFTHYKALYMLYRYVYTTLGPTQPSVKYGRCRVSLPGVERPGRCADHPPDLAPRLKKEYNYTSTPPLCLHGLF
jgi:hypothetical protein